MRRTKQRFVPSLLRVYVNADGVQKIEGLGPDMDSRTAALELVGRIMPAVQRFNREIRRSFYS